MNQSKFKPAPRSKRRPSAADRVVAVLDAPIGGPVEIVRGDARAAVPASVVEMLRLLLLAAASDVPTSATKSHAAGSIVSSQEAADLLRVSRPHVIKLARDEVLPHTMVGSHHRFLIEDVLAYNASMRRSRSKALQELAPRTGYKPGDF
jgi:excisionase family DNA binding protein